MGNSLLTIFTPTYNRAKLLPNLWISLCSQTNKDFIWLIIDDGSTDDTKEIVAKWRKISPFEVIYVYQQNSGKHIAHNRAVSMCQTKLFMCVDSDDILTSDAVEFIHKYFTKFNGDNIIGWITRKQNLNRKIESDIHWPKNEPRMTIIDLFGRCRFHGETALVLKTKYLRLHYFPLISGEKFVTESVLYYQLSFEGVLQLKNEFFYLFKYHNDGYTKQGIKLKAMNPIGTSLDFKIRSAIMPTIRLCFWNLLKYKAWNRCFDIRETQIEAYFKMLEYKERGIAQNGIYNKLASILSIGAQAIIWVRLCKMYLGRKN